MMNAGMVVDCEHMLDPKVCSFLLLRAARSRSFNKASRFSGDTQSRNERAIGAPQPVEIGLAICGA
jgi:hypothetical protein